MNVPAPDRGHGKRPRGRQDNENADVLQQGGLFAERDTQQGRGDHGHLADRLRDGHAPPGHIADDGDQGDGVEKSRQRAAENGVTPAGQLGLQPQAVAARHAEGGKIVPCHGGPGIAASGLDGASGVSAHRVEKRTQRHKEEQLHDGDPQEAGFPARSTRSISCPCFLTELRSVCPSAKGEVGRGRQPVGLQANMVARR